MALSKILPWLFGLALAGAVAWWLPGMFDGKARKPRKPPQVSLLPDRPPPPPPKEEKKPEPPKPEQKEVKVETPKEPAPQAQNEPLKMEGAAGDGPSAFAAGPVTREDNFGAGGRMAFAFYTNNLQRYLQDELAKHKRLRRADYRMQVRVWLAADGAIQRVEIAGSSGNAEVDETVRSALAAMGTVREAPPESMPQPIRLRIANRGAG